MIWISRPAGILNSYIDTFVKWDLLSFFYNNPHTIDTVDNIARYAGRDEETVQQELTGLAAKGLLEETKWANWSSMR